MKALITGLLAAIVASAQPTAQDLLDQNTLARIGALSAAMDGVLGFHAIDLTTGRTLSLNADTAFPQASSIKIPIMIQMFKSVRAGKFKLTDPVTIKPDDSVGGSGHLRIMLRRGPVTLTVRELIDAMIETSDNTATNRCIAMAGMDQINRTLDELGFSKTRLNRIMLDTAAAAGDRENISTPHEMARLMELIYRGKAVDAEASKEMLEIMKRVDANMRPVIPASIEVASKPGDLTGVRCETGVIFLPNRPFVLSVNSTFLGSSENPVGRVTRILFEHFEKLAKSNSYGNKLQ